jgi:indolepyruvate ferredoxin oxidoreductase, alpha subunit
MVLRDVISSETKTVFLLGNEAIVRGALEADVKVAAFYPGAPASEILDTFSEVSGLFDYRMEISANEKVALEVCAGASFVGLRSLTAMKSVGTNVASDMLFTLGYVGVRGGLVIVIADDPHAHSSQTEQDGRLFAPASYIPMFEPASPDEAKEMVKKAFETSEKFRVPVIVRTVTRVNHQSGMVHLGKLERTPFKRVKWAEIKEKYLTLGEVARQNKLKMLERTAHLREEFERSEFNVVDSKDSDVGIVSSSVSYLYVQEALKALDLNSRVSVLKLGTTYPLPEKVIANFIRKLKKLVVVEELSPYLEKEIYVIAKGVNPGLEIVGKLSGAFSEAWEYNANVVIKVLSSVFNLSYPSYEAIVEEAKKLKGIIPDRFPTFCAGCPHRATFVALNQAFRIQASKGRSHFFASDIGCYSMWVFPPISEPDSSLCMGASVGLANGLSYAIEERPISVVGDSTFYHAAIPAIIDAVHNGNKFTLLVLDNSVTAMTGQQPNPSTAQIAGGKLGKSVSIEAICRAMGIEFVETVDAYDVKGNVDVFSRALEFDGLSVVVSRRECALYGDRKKRKEGVEIVPFSVDKQKCKRPYSCLRTFYCPAHELDEDKQPRISQDMCDGCSVCSRLCPLSSISRKDLKG